MKKLIGQSLVAVLFASAPVHTALAEMLLVHPTIGESFTPDAISAGGLSTLTLVLSNGAPFNDTLAAPLIDTLPGGLTVFGEASNTCGGVVTALPGASTVTLTGGVIPAHGSCIVTVDVTANFDGDYPNALPIGALETQQDGSNLEPALATLSVRCLGKGCRRSSEFDPRE